MKKNLFYLFLLFFIFNNANAQSSNEKSIPGGMLFQAVAKDDLGNPAKSREVHAIVCFLKGSASGIIEYSEKFVVTSNTDGIFTLIIGKGTDNPDGTYNPGIKTSIYDLDWSSTNYFINIKSTIF